MNAPEGNTNSELNQPVHRYLAAIGLGLALLAGTVLVISGLGTRFGIWNFRTGLALLRVAAIAGGLAAALSFLAGVFVGAHRRSVRMAVAGIVIGLVVAGIPWSWYRTAKQVPAIHDITTDLNNPPAFSAIMPLRKDAENSAKYGGRTVAEKQVLAYPDIGPLVTAEAPDVVFTRALAVARDMGWKIVADDPKQGRIEATATTFWFGFKDDIVVRISVINEGSRVDIRSASRVGKSDVGTNAERIRRFLANMKIIQ